MKDQFANPSAGYRPTPFWFWNHKLDPDEIERQIREMRAKGVGGFFIHGRFGLETDYLSPEWMGMVKHAVEVAKELGMHAWLYDENPFPSGVGGGLIMRDRKNWCKFLDLVRETVGAQESVELAIPEGKVISAAAVDLESRAMAMDLRDCVSGGRLCWTAPAGGWEIMVFVERLAEAPFFIYGSEPDYFEPGMVEEWLQVTHEAYAKYVGEYFGSGIEGIFTDEPKIQCAYHAHDDPFTTAWFRGLPELFEHRFGYDLIPNLPALFTDFGPDPGKVRRDFWRLVGEEYRNRLFKPYHDWCRTHGIKMTGHLFLEEGLYANTMYQADFMEDMACFDIPGTDHLGLAAETPYAINVIPGSITRTQGQKIASSSAHIYNKPRTLSETFGCDGWELSMANMKWIVDWQYTLGVNMLCPHAFYYSLAGVRKTDAPPSQFYQATWWKYYKHFADYVGRLSLALTQGKHKAQIAMLYPIVSFHSEWAVGTQGPADSFIAGCYDWYCKNLVLQHLDYDLVTEKTIQESGVSNGKMKIAGEEYELLLLPPVTAMELPTLKKIEQFVQAGGKVLATGLLPAVDARPDGTGSPASQEMIDIIHRLFNEEPVTLRCDFEQGYDEERGPTFGLSCEGRTGLIRCNRAHLLGGMLREAVESFIWPDVRVTRGSEECQSVNAVRRSTEMGEVVFFANTSGEALDVEISLGASGFPEQWDLETGARYRITDYMAQGAEGPGSCFDTAVIHQPTQHVRGEFTVDSSRFTDRTTPPDSPECAVNDARIEGRLDQTHRPSIHPPERTLRADGSRSTGASGSTDHTPQSDRLMLPWHFEPYGSLLLVLSKQENTAEPLPMPGTSTLPLVELSDTWRFRTESGNVCVLKDWRLDINASQDWTKYRYESTVSSKFHPERAFLVLDDLRPGEHTQGSRIDVEVNGAKVDPEGPIPWMVDVNFPAMDISGRLHEGENTIAVTITHGGWAGPPKLMTAPQYLLGDFSLEQEGEAFVLVPPKTELHTGSWAEQGYPFYSGTGIYSQTVSIPGPSEHPTSNAERPTSNREGEAPAEPQTPLSPPFSRGEDDPSSPPCEGGVGGGSGRRVMLEVEDPADMVEVWVNGEHAGTRPWPPYAVDISEHVRAGENEIEVRVTNSLANMLRPVARRSGLMGRVRVVELGPTGG